MALSHNRLVSDIVSCMIVACLVTLFFVKNTTAHQLHAWKVLPQPERFTELYFADYQHLPIITRPGTAQNVAFTIHNLEHRTTAYHYVITAAAAAKQQIVGEGTTPLTHNSFRTINRTIIAPAMGPRAEIQVRIEYYGIPPGQEATRLETQAIHYWSNSSP